MARPTHDRPSAHTLVVIVALMMTTGTTTAQKGSDGDHSDSEPEEPAVPTNASSGRRALWAALATVAGSALVAAGLATVGGLLAAAWGGIFLTLADGLLRSLPRR